MSKPRHSTIQFNPTEWLATTARMPRVVRGVFFDLACYSWERAEPVPASEVFLMVSDLPDGQGAAIIENLIAGGHLKRNPDDSVYSPKALEQGERARALHEAHRRGGRGKASEAEKAIREHVEAELAKVEEPEVAPPPVVVATLGAAEIADAWNAMARRAGLKQIARMTAERTGRLNERIAEHGAEAIIAAIGRMAGNQMVLATKPTFDAILSPKTCKAMIERGDEPDCG